MAQFFKQGARVLRVPLLLCLSSAALLAQSQTGSLRGQVLDPSGAIVPGVTITAAGSDGTIQVATTNGEGRYALSGLAPGRYAVRAAAKGFGLYENTGVEITAGRVETLDIHLVVSMEKQEVTVNDTAKVDVNPTSNVGAIVLKGQDLDALSDDPDDLAADLQALAGPAAGPNGGQIYIDGFTGGQLPPKSSIREVRVNQNPFSAEFDRLGFGRIEILTKPGTDKLRGQASFSFGDSNFNSRNPFAPNRPPYQQKRFEGNLSGPITKKGSFFLGLERQDIGEASVINATILDPSFNITSFSQAVPNSRTSTEFNPRIDYQLNSSNTLTARIGYNPDSRNNLGIGQFALPSQAYNSTGSEHTIQVTETAMLSDLTVDETRFRFLRARSSQMGNSSQPQIDVPQAFTSGGPSFNQVTDNSDHYELQNLVLLNRHKHALKLGGRLRHDSISDFNDSNYNGRFLFSSIDIYRSVLLGQGGKPSQFSITFGDKLAGVGQSDVALFAQDDWRVWQNFSLSLGLRYETQNNISDRADFAPRVGFAWGIGSGKSRQPKTVIRGGAGIFYDRFSESLTLQALRLNGKSQRQYVVPFPDFFPTVPTEASLRGNLAPQAIRQIDPNLRAPYIAQAAVGVERQLPKSVMVALTYTHSRGVHNLRSRNINAPLPGTFDPLVPNSGVRPDPTRGNVYSYESTGIFNQNQLIANINARVGAKFTLFGFYMLNDAKSDTDGAGTFPANPYNLAADYSRAAFDVHQRLFMGGSFVAPWSLRFSPFVTASSGSPFDITAGQDLNGDSIFNDRPAFATDLTRPDVKMLDSVAFDPHPQPGQTIIPRNYGNGPGSFTVNLRLSKTIGFGEKAGASAAAQNGGFPGGGGGPRVVEHGGERGGRPGGGAMRMGGGMRGGGLFGDSFANKRYNLTFSISARNLFNTVNLAPPVGNLSSRLFGQSTGITSFGFGGPGGGSASANRRLELSLRFIF